MVVKYFVNEDSIVRTIWGKSDTILFIFAGAAAEFALNKAVDWLYYTGKLPADPLGRLFSTVTYARLIVFSTYDDALTAIDRITAIHKHVEHARQDVIPDWAYRDVLFMLIYYSIAAYELLERKLSNAEKEALYNVFYRMGIRMHLKDLPETYQAWLPVRENHMLHNLEKSKFTIDLFKQYKKHLGFTRYKLLLQAQSYVVPAHVRNLLQLPKTVFFAAILTGYKLSRLIRADGFIKMLIMPANYSRQIKELDQKIS